MSACQRDGGGFSHDTQRIARAYPHLQAGGEHFSPVPRGNTGDGARLAEKVGGRVEIRYSSRAAWMPTSKVPLGKGEYGPSRTCWTATSPASSAC
jgi:hypothetical protein